MTIVYRGHVDKIEIGHPAKHERFHIVGDSSVCETNPLIINVPNEIAKQYRVGTPIQVTIIPLAPVNPSTQGERQDGK